MTESIGTRLRKLSARYPIDDSLVIGLDVGIASLGSGAIRHGVNGGAIEFAGSWCFEAPEEPKTKELKNKTRRDSRLLRRVIRRRARRMADVRTLFVETGLLLTRNPAAFHHRRGAPDPWRARADGLDRRLNDEEFAAALLYIAKHRGFKSNKKSDIGQNAPDDNKKMLGAIDANRELLSEYGSIGRMVVNDPKFAERRRNKGGEYTHTFARDDLLDEVKQLFAAQRRLGNDKATAELENGYIGIAFHQRPLQDSEDLIGICPFEPEEKRSPRHAPSFEKFRFLAKLNTVKLRELDGSLRRLSGEELRRAAADFGIGSKSMSWNALATKIGLSKGTFFDGIDEKKAKADIVASKGCAAGSKTLYDAVGPAGWNTLKDKPELLDRIAAVIAFREDQGSIEKGLEGLDDLDSLVRTALMKSVSDGNFGAFKGAGHISAKAARNILPHLLERNVYSEACALAGYDHTQSRKVEIDDIRNPVVQRSLRAAVKQVETLVHHFGARPGRIIVELAREVGKSAEERDRITRGIERRTAEKDRRRDELKEKLELRSEPAEEDLRRYELWKEQNYRCIYTDKLIEPRDILATSNAVQVDHILPRSRSQDNSYLNQVLCMTEANQDKGQRTPWEWKGTSDPGWWDTFDARVRALNIKGIKKRNLLMPNFDEREQGFVERNLNDTKYAARALLSVLRELYTDQGEPDPASEGYLGKTTRRLFARPGAVTAILRRAWGLGGIKDRADSRHHALDALICAAARSEWLLNALTRQYQQVEVENRGKWTPFVPPPWEGFRDDAIQALEGVFVARSEKRRGRGQGHADTIYRIGVEDGRKVTYERKAVANLTEGDLSRLKDAEGGNRPLAAALATWIGSGKPAETPPRSPRGDIVRKVLLKRRGSDPSGLQVNGGHVDNADMMRVDVFVKPNKKGKDEYFLVPIYRHQVMDRKGWPQPPNRAVRAHKPEKDWEVVNADFHFCFSIYGDSFLEVVKRDGSVFEGYFRSMNRSTGALAISPHNRRDEYFEGGAIGARTLASFRKFQIDRFGCRHEIEQETRTWHGAACT
ncbi:MAG: type II CRISPR RNA-guided endonuclease Cas9 [Rhodovibrionaceae bacterium]